jgi:hypothetical protein
MVDGKRKAQRLMQLRHGEYGLLEFLTCSKNIILIVVIIGCVEHPLSCLLFVDSLRRTGTTTLTLCQYPLPCFLLAICTL